MKNLIYSLFILLLTAGTTFAQKAPNWPTPNANNPSIGIHHDNVPPRTKKPSPAPNTIQPTPIPPASNTPALANTSWQLNSWDNWGSYSIRLSYLANGQLQVNIFRPNAPAYAYTSSWSYNNGVLYNNNCNWMSQGRLYLDPNGRHMAFYSAWFPGHPIYLQRVG